MELFFLFGVLAIFLWLLFSRGGDASLQRGGSTGAGRPEQSLEIGVGTGLMGGDIEDAAIARYALSRTPKDSSSSNARDLGAALGAQNAADASDCFDGMGG